MKDGGATALIGKRIKFKATSYSLFENQKIVF